MVDKQVAEASALLRKRLKEVMRQQGIKSQEKLSEYLGISHSTIGPYFWPKELSLPMPETLQKLREKIPGMTDDDVRTLETAYSRKASLSRAHGAEKRWGKKKRSTSRSAPPNTSQGTTSSVSSNNDTMDTDTKIGRLVRQLVAEVIRNGSTKAITSDPIALLGSHAKHQYDVGDMPWILTKDNFETLDVSTWSKAEQQQFLGHANHVLEESRKCMLLLAQFEPHQIRDALLERLARNADLLWRTYKAASSVAPIEYVSDIDLTGKCEKI